MSYLYIDTQNDFDTLCAELEDTSQGTDNYIALDTEFMRDKSYYSKLALLQVCSKSLTAIIDPLALDNMQALLAVLSNPAIIKVFHAGTQDIEIFYNIFGSTPQNIFDTQLAASALGLGNQIGYADLVKKLLGKSLSKSHTRTHWLDRPLKTGPLEYAADDVIYLYQLYPIMCKKLDSLDRRHWLLDDFEQLTDPEHYQVKTDTLWRKVKGHQRLRGVQLAIIDEIVRWRERIAIEKNTPRKFVLKDEVILDIARHKPTSADQCLTIRHFPKYFSQTQLDALLQAIKDGLNTPQQDWPRLPEFKKLSKHQEAIADTLMTIMKWAAAKNEIGTDTLGSRKDIDQLVKNYGTEDTKSPLLEGWRFKNVGCYLQDFLEGKISISVKNSMLELSSEP